jgi:hypothetical protein
MNISDVWVLSEHLVLVPICVASMHPPLNNIHKLSHGDTFAQALLRHQLNKNVFLSVSWCTGRLQSPLIFVEI